MTVDDALEYYIPILQREFNNIEYGKVFFFLDEIGVRWRKFTTWLETEHKIQITRTPHGHEVVFLSDIARREFMERAEQHRTMDLLTRTRF